jgi:hypothetical protein
VGEDATRFGHRVAPALLGLAEQGVGPGEAVVAQHTLLVGFVYGKKRVDWIDRLESYFTNMNAHTLTALVE